MANFIENLVEKAFGEVTERRQYREYKERVKTLPKNYRAAVEALERYLLVRGSQSKQDDALVPILVDLADQFEQAATDSTPIRTLVGEDPAEFAEATQVHDHYLKGTVHCGLCGSRLIASNRQATSTATSSAPAGTPNAPTAPAGRS